MAGFDLYIVEYHSIVLVAIISPSQHSILTSIGRQQTSQSVVKH